MSTSKKDEGRETIVGQPLGISEINHLVLSVEHKTEPRLMFYEVTNAENEALGWGVMVFTFPDKTCHLYTARNKIRVFSTLDAAYSAVSHLHDHASFRII